MGTAYVIALAKESEVSKCKDWNALENNLQRIQTSIIREVVNTSLDAHSEDEDPSEVFEAVVEEVKQNPISMTSISFVDSDEDELLEIVELCRLLAKKLGSVTLIGENFSQRVEIHPSSDFNRILAVFNSSPASTTPINCPKCGRKSGLNIIRCMYCGQILADRSS